MLTLLADMWHQFLTKPINNFFKSFLTWHILFHTIVCLGISSTIYVIENLWQLENALKTCHVIVGGCQAIGMFVSMGLKMEKINIFQRNFEAIVSETVQSKRNPLF